MTAVTHIPMKPHCVTLRGQPVLSVVRPVLTCLLFSAILAPLIVSAGFPTPTPPPTVCAFSEGFDNLATLPPTGWVMLNHSTPFGTTNWFQGTTTGPFPAQAGLETSYIAVNYASGGSIATISNWLLTPSITLQNGAKLSFWSRTPAPVPFPDRLQVRMSTNGTSTNVGSSATAVGDFTTLLLDVNPTYTTTGYPTEWTNFVVTITGLGGPTTGRLAFRYFVENGGPSGANSDYIGIDSATYNCNGGPTPTPTPTPSPSPTPPTFASQMSQAFDNITTLPAAGWVTQNNSSPLGSTGWFQGLTAVFPAQSGAADSYIAANSDNAGNGTGATISNWLLTPPLDLTNFSPMNFWTRTMGPVSIPDRLQVRMSTNGTSTNVGTSPTDVGDFTTLLLDINPTYTTTGYPTVWTHYSVTLPQIFGSGRLAFRYFVENGGPGGAHSNYIGIDNVTYCSFTDCFFGTINVSGTVTNCANPSSAPVSHVMMTLGNSYPGQAVLTASSGTYAFTPLQRSFVGTYIVTPTKVSLTPGTQSINTIDVLAIQRHFLNITPIPAGCRLTAANVNGDASIDTVDVIAVQRFFLGQTTGIANTGGYTFNPATRSYSAGLEGDFIGNYDALVLGDVAMPYVP